jgi:Protein of unknown function (DUF1236)
MSKLLVTIATLAMLAGIPAAHAQTPAPSEPPATPRAAPTARVNLTLEQRHVIKELIKDLNVEPTRTPVQAAVGEALPADVTPQPIPNEVGRKVPQIKTHRFLVTADQIIIVDPKDNKVAELIELKAN